MHTRKAETIGEETHRFRNANETFQTDFLGYCPNAHFSFFKKKPMLIIDYALMPPFRHMIDTCTQAEDTRIDFATEEQQKQTVIQCHQHCRCSLSSIPVRTEHFFTENPGIEKRMPFPSKTFVSVQT